MPPLWALRRSLELGRLFPCRERSDTRRDERCQPRRVVWYATDFQALYLPEMSYFTITFVYVTLLVQQYRISRHGLEQDVRCRAVYADYRGEVSSCCVSTDDFANDEDPGTLSLQCSANDPHDRGRYTLGTVVAQEVVESTFLVECRRRIDVSRVISCWFGHDDVCRWSELSMRICRQLLNRRWKRISTHAITVYPKHTSSQRTELRPPPGSLE